VIDLPHFWLFLGGALLLNITPGPDMAFTLASAARGGAKSGLSAAAGIVTGCLGWAVLTAAGMAALLAASEHALVVIKVLGGAYLLFLAWKTFRSRDALPDVQGARDWAAAFRSGLLTNLFNPKVGLFFLAFLPTFTNPAAGPVWLQTMLLGSMFCLSGGGVLAVVAFGAGALRDSLARSRNLRVALNSIAATAFGALGLRLLASRP
jgi:threonine/homoserine/homoserine lactone efflux protein